MAEKIVLASLEIDMGALIKSTSELKAEIDRLKDSQKELTKEGDTASEQYVQNAADLKALNTAYNANVKAIAESTKAQADQANQTKLVSVAINTEVKSIKEARDQNSLLNRLRNETNVSTAEGKAQLEALNKKLDENNAFIKENADQYLKQKINIGNYKDSIKEAFSEMNIFNGGIVGFIERSKEAGGAGNLLSNSFGTIKDSIIGMTKSALAFIATPIGAAIAGVVAIGAGVKQIFDFNKGLVETNKELRALGVNSSELSAVRDEISATAQTFDKDFKDIASKANSLSKAYGISMSEANKIIAEGLATGGAQNSEFLDSMGEYDVFFANAGFSAQEFANIINTGYDLGIYADKLPDALKEADLALKENTKSTRDALVNAFGATFSDEILSKVSSGQLTTKQAIDEITKASQTANLSQQQYAQLTADVFKGAGEDVGGAQKIFEALGKSATKELDASANASLRLVEANERLNKAQSDLFEIENFGDIWTSIKAVSVDAFSAILEYVADLKNDLQPIIDIVGVVFLAVWENLKFSVTTAFDVISGVVKSFASYFGGIIQFWKKLLTGDFKGAFVALADGISNAFKNIGNIFVNLYNNVLKLVSGIADVASPLLKALGVDVDGLKKRIDGLKASTFEIKGEVKTAETKSTTNEVQNKTFGSGGGGATNTDIKERQKAEDTAAKEQYAKAKELADAKANLAKAQLDKYIFDLKSNIDKETELTPEIIANETQRLEDIKSKQIQFNNDELSRKKSDLEAKAKLEGTSLEVLNAQKEALNLEYETRNQELELGVQKTTAELKDQFEQEQKVKKAEQLAIDKELALAEAETKAEEDAIKAEEQYNLEMERLNKLLTDKKITQDQFDALKASADKKNEEMARIAALNRTQAQLQEFQKVGAGLEGLFGKNKAIASATALINGGLAVTEILKTPSTFPEPYASILRGIQIAGTVATTARSIAQINGAKFEKGGIQEIGGKRHSGGGTKFYGEDGTTFEAERGEGIGILNRSAFSTFMDFNNRFGSGSSSGGFFQGGGIITQGVRSESTNMDAVVDAIASIPAPVVAVEEIQSVGNRFVQVQQNANL